MRSPFIFHDYLIINFAVSLICSQSRIIEGSQTCNMIIGINKKQIKREIEKVRAFGVIFITIAV